MGFDKMRSGHGRLPTYIVAGLLLMSFLLMCNWWSLSSQNSELLRQMDDLGSQLNICSDERVICMSKRNSADSQLRDVQAKSLAIEATQREEVAKLKKQKVDLEKSAYNAKQDLTFCKTELESLKKVDTSKEATLQALRVEKNNLVSQLNIAKEKITQLEEEIKKMKEQPLAIMPKYTSSTDSQKNVKLEVPEALQEPSLLSNEPLQGANHEWNKDNETGLDNAANEEFDDMEPETGKRPPTKQ